MVHARAMNAAAPAEAPLAARPVPLLLWHLGRRGAGPLYTYELAKVLRDVEGLSVHLCLSRQSDYFEQTVALGLPLLAVDTYRDLSSAALATLRLGGVRRRLRDYVAKHGIEVALCTMAHLWNPLLVPALRRGGARNLLVMHDATAHPGENYGIRNLMFERDMRVADGIVALTEAVREQLIATYAYPRERTWVVPCGGFVYGDAAPGPRRLKPGRRPRLLFFGRILPYKGLAILSEALELLKSEGLSVDLDVVGHGDLGTVRLPEGTRVVNRWIREEEVAGFFRDADLMVLPYVEASQSGVLAVSNPLGIPAVVTPAGGLAEQIGHGAAGFVTRDATPAAIAEGIRELLTDPEAYARASRAALELATGPMSWARIGESIAQIATTVAALDRRA